MLKNNAKRLQDIKALEEQISGKSYRYIPKEQIVDSRLFRNTIHDGDILVMITNKKGLDSSIKELSEGRAKFRIVFKDDVTEEDIKSIGINVKSFKRDGRIIVITVKGSEKETAAKLNTLSPIMVEPMPLSLEEVFLDEMEGTNYDFSKIF